MELYLALILVFLVSIFASFFGAMVGGGGLITIPLLIFLGLPPQVAIASNKFGSLGLRFASLYRYWKANKIIWSYIAPLTILSVVSAFIGAQLLIELNNELLSKIVGIAIVVILPFIFFSKGMGVKRFKVSKLRKRIGYFLYLIVAIWHAFFGGGGGTLTYYVMMVFFGFPIIKGNATQKIPGLALTIIALIIFGIHGIINYLYGFVVLVGMSIGGYLGAHTAVKKGDVWVKTVFAIVVIASAVKLIFF